MSGALVDLVAIGVQDTYLTGDPQTTYFRQAYKRHTNFAMEPVRQVIEGDAATGAWSQVNITRNGDLLTDVYFLADSDGNTPIIAPFQEVQLYIGGQHIDTITRDENIAMAQQFRLNNSASNLAPTAPNQTNGSHSLNFFFGRGYSCALPLCALQYHDVTLRIKWSDVASSFSLYADYVQLDTAERNAFASKPLTMLIEQHQRTPYSISAGAGSSYAELQFSHPVKAVYTANVQSANGGADTAGIPLSGKLKISFNGKQRTPSLPVENYYVDHQGGKHTEYGIQSANFPMYSFALYPNRNTPTGSCNFSRLDNARAELTTIADTAAADGDYYALNWNFLKIENGMGGLLFAN